MPGPEWLQKLPWQRTAAANAAEWDAAEQQAVRNAELDPKQYTGFKPLDDLRALYSQGRIDRDAYINGMMALMGDYERWKKEKNKDPEQVKADALAAELDAFSRELMGPLNLNDPTTRAIINDVTAKVSTGVGRSGIEGGMANAAVGRGVGDAALQLHNQRQQFGAGVMQNRLGDQRQLNAMRDQAARMKLNDEYMNKLSEWESQRGAGQQIGGVLGSIGGGLLGFFTGGPLGAAAGASAGYGVGSGIGGSVSGGPPSAPVYNSPYYGGGSGGMSGYNRGGW